MDTGINEGDFVILSDPRELLAYKTVKGIIGRVAQVRDSDDPRYVVSFPLADGNNLTEAFSFDSLRVIKPEVAALLKANELISYETYSKLRLSGHEWRMIYPLLDNNALIKATEEHLANASRMIGKTPTTYDEALIHVFIPILLKRIAESDPDVFSLRRLLHLV